jgi:hypothetical protein|tara:strand:+ start:163 stop:759 length:597 start_codon:yes stop_codon:yes gene_type:complete
MNYFTPFMVPIFYEDCFFAERDTLIQSLTEKVRNNNPGLNQVNNIKDEQFDYFVQSKFEDVFYNQLNHTKKAKPVLVSCWYNFYETGAEIPTHSHKNSYYSGVYYPYGNIESPIIFENPLEQSLIICPEVEERNNFNYITYKVSCPGECILFFPSYLRHYTMAGSNKKHSISFNFFVEGLLSAGTKSNFNVILQHQPE